MRLIYRSATMDDALALAALWPRDFYQSRDEWLTACWRAGLVSAMEAWQIDKAGCLRFNSGSQLLTPAPQAGDRGFKPRRGRFLAVEPPSCYDVR